MRKGKTARLARGPLQNFVKISVGEATLVVLIATSIAIGVEAVEQAVCEANSAFERCPQRHRRLPGTVPRTRLRTTPSSRTLFVLRLACSISPLRFIPDSNQGDLKLCQSVLSEPELKLFASDSEEMILEGCRSTAQESARITYHIRGARGYMSGMIPTSHVSYWLVQGRHQYSCSDPLMSSPACMKLFSAFLNVICVNARLHSRISR